MRDWGLSAALPRSIKSNFSSLLNCSPSLSSARGFLFYLFSHFWMAAFVGCGMDLVISFHLVLSTLLLWVEQVGDRFHTCCLNGMEERPLSNLAQSSQGTKSLISVGECPPWAQDSRDTSKLGWCFSDLLWGRGVLAASRMTASLKPQNQSANQTAILCWAATVHLSHWEAK